MFSLLLVWTRCQTNSPFAVDIILDAIDATHMTLLWCALPYLSKLPWIFPGAPLTCNGAPRNIQGYLDRYDLLFAVWCYMDTAMKRSHSYHSIPVKLPWIFPGAPLKVNGAPRISRVTWQVSNRYLLAHPRPLLIYQEDTMLLVYRDSHYKPEMIIRPL